MRGRQPGRPLAFEARTNQVFALKGQPDADYAEDDPNRYDIGAGGAVRHHLAGSHLATAAARIDLKAARNVGQVCVGNSTDLINSRVHSSLQLLLPDPQVDGLQTFNRPSVRRITDKTCGADLTHTRWYPGHLAPLPPKIPLVARLGPRRELWHRLLHLPKPRQHAFESAVQ